MELITIISILICVAFFTVLAIIIVSEHKKDEKERIKYMQYDMSKINEIYDIEEQGICHSCDHGIQKCLEEGEAFCNKANKEKEKDNEKRPV